MHAGWNALHLACYIGNLEMVKWLIDVCALSPAIKDKNGTSPIHSAIKGGYTEIVEFLVEYDGSLVYSLHENTGFYPLHLAVEHNRLGCFLVLLKHNRTSYHIALQGGSRKCKYLFTNS